MKVLESENQLNVFQEYIKFIKYLFSRQISNFFVILGRRGSGKTDFALLLAETLYYLDIVKHIASNIKIISSPFPITYIINLDDLRLWCKNTPGKKLFILDELGKSARRRTPMKSVNIKILDNMQILRKYKLSIIGITVHQKYADSAFFGPEMLDGVFHKINFRNQKEGYYEDQLEELYKPLYDIPRTNIEFDTWDIAPFTEHSTQTPRFKDQDIQSLWDLTHGKNASDLGLHSQQVARLWRKFVKETLERDSHLSQIAE